MVAKGHCDDTFAVCHSLNLPTTSMWVTIRNQFRTFTREFFIELLIAPGRIIVKCEPLYTDSAAYIGLEPMAVGRHEPSG